MRILHVSTRLILGGSQENTILSCEGQCRKGHEVHLAFGPIFGPEGSMLPRVEGFNSRRVVAGESTIGAHVVPHMVREVDPRQDFKAYRELRRLIADLQPDIVHTHSSKAGIIGRAAAWAEGGRSGRLRVVHTIHGPPFHRYESSWRNMLYAASERFAAGRCHRIVSVADAMTTQFLALGIGRADQYITVRSGIELDPFLSAPAPGATRDEVRQDLGLDASDVVVGTIARLAELKGHDDLLDALEPDLRQRPELKLLWVGDGWWTNRLTERLLRMELRHKVLMPGIVPPERIPAMLRAMDVVAHPSYREGLPRVVPQALLAGLPVVAYDTDGTGEACIDAMQDPARGTGRLVAAGDLLGLRRALLWSIDERALALEAAARGRALCRERFGADAMVDALENVYAAALS